MIIYYGWWWKNIYKSIIDKICIKHKKGVNIYIDIYVADAFLNSAA